MIAMKSSCTDCSRRTLLKGLGLAVLGACTTPTPPTGTASTCGANLCLDLADPANKELTAAGGSLVVDSGTDTIMVVRVSDTEVVALSAICTHAGCENLYTASSMTFDCPCHGSKFSLTGQVINGPARRPLAVYSATLANNIITITL
jgi:cytochrome b6-f complex iron-sulfur subunit